MSKFSKVLIFSDLNNLVELTMDARTATMLGYTHDEVKKYFSEHLAALGAANGITPEESFDKVVAMYDGYRFHQGAERVVNPEIVPLLFQTGYLTIKSMETIGDLRLYRLGFPNAAASPSKTLTAEQHSVGNLHHFCYRFLRSVRRTHPGKYG